MKRTFIIMTLLFGIVGYAQVTNIPDQNFEQALIDEGIDSDGVINGEVFTADIIDLVELDVGFNDIEDLTGIEDFISLEILRVQYNLLEEIDLRNLVNLRIVNLNTNSLTEIDVSQNIALEELYIGNPEIDVTPLNDLETIDITNNPNLVILDCFYVFGLDNLDVSNNPLLEELIMPFCGLSSLDVSNNVNLKVLDLGFVFSEDPSTISNNLSELDVSANINLIDLKIASTTIRTVNTQNGIDNEMMVDARMAAQLECILVDDEGAAIAGTGEYEEWNIPDGVTFSETECILGLEDTSLFELSLFPNPTKDQVSFLGIAPSQVRVISVFDITGKLLATKKGSTSIALGALKSGVYFIVFSDTFGNSVNRRVIKE